MNVYQRLKDLREDKDLTQIQCAKIAYISKNTYIRYEKGEREPPLDVIINLAKFYKVSIDYIAGLTNDKRGIGYSEEKFNSKYNISQNGNGKNIVKIKE